MVVYMLGRLALEDFQEIMLVCANGYGMAGLKLLRPMFEATITARYLRLHPEEAAIFLRYHYVHRRKTLKIAESVGVDLSDRYSQSQIDEIESMYQEIKGHYRQVACNDCGRKGELTSWTKKDMVSMAREVGLERGVLVLYFFPTLQIHSTPARLFSRLEESGEKLCSSMGHSVASLMQRSRVPTCVSTWSWKIIISALGWGSTRMDFFGTLSMPGPDYPRSAKGRGAYDRRHLREEVSDRKEAPDGDLSRLHDHRDS
jgi:hypothetical protein